MHTALLNKVNVSLHSWYPTQVLHQCSSMFINALRDIDDKAGIDIVWADGRRRYNTGTRSNLNCISLITIYDDANYYLLRRWLDPNRPQLSKEASRPELAYRLSQQSSYASTPVLTIATEPSCVPLHTDRLMYLIFQPTRYLFLPLNG